ncbi:MAG: pyridoxal phosphate-dependent aminotransferase [Acidimicrobiia bacterium]|nr:MAG: pyridoxal phosphate-dependent aminotransferase [Acidimicrobiia bacterium]
MTGDTRIMDSAPPLADRGTQLTTGSPMPMYSEEHFERIATSDPDDPDRYIGLCVAQNLLMWDLLEHQLNRNRDVKPKSVAYDAMIGSQEFRKQIAAFMFDHVWRRPVDAEQVITLAGAGSVLETLFYVIADPGEGVLIPTPSYAGYWADLETRDALTVVPVHTSSKQGFRLTPALLEKAYQDATIPIPALMLTNPDNPTGRIMPSDDLRDAVDWARSHGLHIVVNEIYALSVHGDRPFTPVGSVIENLAADVHEVWGFGKDFAMSGVRCGVMTSNNADVLKAIGELAYWSVVSGDTQHLLAEMLSDTDWTVRFLAEMRSRIRQSYRATIDALDAAAIPYVDGDAGIFLLTDMRSFMDAPTWESEDRLWRRILEDANVNLTPGSACHVGEPGFMRICFATEPPEVVSRAIERIATVIG